MSPISHCRLGSKAAAARVAGDDAGGWRTDERDALSPSFYRSQRERHTLSLDVMIGVIDVMIGVMGECGVYVTIGAMRECDV